MRDRVGKESVGDPSAVPTLEEVARSVLRSDASDGLRDRRSLTEAATLTREDLDRAMQRAQEEDYERARAKGERYLGFIESIPEGLRSHDLVVLMATYISEGIVVHPNDARRMNAKLAKLIEEHRAKLRGEHPSGLWVPPAAL